MTKLFLLSLLLLASCTHEHQVKTLPADILGRQVTISTVAGQTLEAVAEPTPTGVVWRASDGTRVDAREVKDVETTSHGRGLLQGMAFGLAIGVGVGALIGFASGDDECYDICILSKAEEKAVIGAVLVSVPAVVVGGVIGAIAGSRDRYVLLPEERFRVSATPMPGGGAVRMTWSF